VPPGSPGSRVTHAHPLTPDARASRAAIAFRRADRAAARSGRGPRRLALPATGLLAISAALLLASPLSGLLSAGTGTGGGLQAGVNEPGTGRARPTATLTAQAEPTVGPVPTADAVSTAAPAASLPILGLVESVAAEKRKAANGYVWPVRNARITQAFGPSAGGLFIVDGKAFHDGIDLANFCGAPILAAHAGTVVAASRHIVGQTGWTGDLGAYDAYMTSKGLWGTAARVIVIDDGNGLRSVYIHLHRIDVTVGQVVKAGQQIGLEGSSGHATGCHLHYSIYDPSSLESWTTNPKDTARYHLPSGEIARIDPITLLPSLASGAITWGWGAGPGD
jgi:murein DD-endopeptidase MepM/ murein hydrolase activator NlpD